MKMLSLLVPATVGTFFLEPEEMYVRPYEIVVPLTGMLPPDDDDEDI